MVKSTLDKGYYAVSVLGQGILALTFGVLICKLPFLKQYKRHLLSTWHEKRNRVDNILFNPLFNFWIRFEYLTEKDPDKREGLKELAMAGSSGRESAKEADTIPLDFNAKIGDLTFNEAFPMFGEIENILKEAKTRLLVIQIGSSSGREIAYFANKYQANTYIGTDICQEIADYASSAHRGKNLSFRTLSAQNIAELLSEFQNEKILVFASGALAYVQSEHLPVFFSSIASMPHAKVLLSEPGKESQGRLPDEIGGSRWRGNFTYTHDYKFYAEKANLKTVKSRVIRLPYTISYFYYGETNNCNW